MAARRRGCRRGAPDGWTWVDSTTVVLNEYSRAGCTRWGVRTGARLVEFTRPIRRSGAVPCCCTTEDGRIPSDGLGIRVQRPGEAVAHTYPAAAWFQSIGWLTASPDGRRALSW
jgi:hypothetical protein